MKLLQSVQHVELTLGLLCASITAETVETFSVTSVPMGELLLPLMRMLSQ
uniref:Uncharacterized protein n=1 Tax=Rhizophora mucronata TaxID=61149 RepID=A0A2P2L3A9_RHIMU